MSFVIFDYDGVIINSLPAVHCAVSALADYVGVARPAEDDAKRWLGPIIRDSTSNFIDDHGLDVGRLDELSSFYFDRYVEVAGEMTLAFDGMLELLDELDSRRIPKALATMKSQAEFDAIGLALPGADRFSIVACPLRPDAHSKSALVAEALAVLAVEMLDLTSPGGACSELGLHDSGLGHSSDTHIVHNSHSTDGVVVSDSTEQECGVEKLALALANSKVGGNQAGGLSTVETGWMIGDRSSDIKAGQQNGLRTVGVAWGAGSVTELEGAGADFVVHSVAELRALLVP